MISSFFAIREHNRWTPRMSSTFVTAKMLWNALCISETISYPSHLLQCTSLMPLLSSFSQFCKISFTVSNQDFFYKFAFLSVYSVKEIPKKHLRRPFVACNSIIYWPHLSNKYFYLLIWMSILPLIKDLCCCYKLLMSTSFIKSFSPFRWFALSTDGWQENCKLTSAGIQNAQTSARRW